MNAQTAVAAAIGLINTLLTAIMEANKIAGYSEAQLAEKLNAEFAKFKANDPKLRPIL